MQGLKKCVLIIACYLICHEIPKSTAQFWDAKSIINEYLGRSYSYRVHGGWSSSARNCSHLDKVILDHGYSLITYDNVTSQDGYIQTIFRITGSPSSPPRKQKPAVLLFHGAQTAADSWLLLDEKSLPFKLADAGYEIWLINARGTDYSQRHANLDPNRDLAYWDFSYHEMAVFDLPVYVDLILSETNTKKIFYIGHSLGALVYAAAVSESPDLNDKIHASFLFGGEMFSGLTTSIWRLAVIILDMPPVLQDLLNWSIKGRINAGDGFLNRKMSQLCSSSALACGLCENAMGTVISSRLNHIEVSNIISRAPNTIALKVGLHGSQNYRTCNFRKYDYGALKNIQIYGQSDPPPYNISNLHAPIYIYYGDDDGFAVLGDLRRFRDSVRPGTVKGFHRLEHDHFTHYDFVLTKDASEEVYDRILNDMKQYS